MHTGEQWGLGPPWNARPSSPAPRGGARSRALTPANLSHAGGSLGGQPATEHNWQGARMPANNWRSCQAAK